eukprot:1149811-Pelagomonas_calceolata.AAC.1
MKRNIFNFRTGTLFNQKHAVRFKISTSLQCPLCGEPDSALHILSGCKRSTISDMVTERHNIAGGILLKGISKDPLGAGLATMDNGSADRLALQEPADFWTLNKYNPLQGGAGETGRPPDSKVRHPSQLLPEQRHIHFVDVNTVKTPGPRISLSPPSSSAVTSVAIFQGPQLKSPSIMIC